MVAPGVLDSGFLQRPWRGGLRTVLELPLHDPHLSSTHSVPRTGAQGFASSLDMFACESGSSISQTPFESSTHLTLGK